MGLKTGCVCKVGKDAHAEMVLEDLKKERVDTSFVVKKEGKTGFSVILDAKGHERTILVFKGVNNALRFSEVKKRETQWFYFCTMLAALIFLFFDGTIYSYYLKQQMKAAGADSKWQYIAQIGRDIDEIQASRHIPDREKNRMIKKKQKRIQWIRKYS